MPTITPTISPARKTAAELRRLYDAKLKQCQKVHADGIKLEQRLLAEVKEKVKAHAGDIERLKEEKRAISGELEAAVRFEKAQADAKLAVARASTATALPAAPAAPPAAPSHAGAPQSALAAAVAGDVPSDDSEKQEGEPSGEQSAGEQSSGPQSGAPAGDGRRRNK
jgi:hypothetical protein